MSVGPIQPVGSLCCCIFVLLGRRGGGQGTSLANGEPPPNRGWGGGGRPEGQTAVVVLLCSLATARALAFHLLLSACRERRHDASFLPCLIDRPDLTGRNNWVVILLLLLLELDPPFSLRLPRTERGQDLPCRASSSNACSVAQESTTSFREERDRCDLGLCAKRSDWGLGCGNRRKK